MMVNSTQVLYFLLTAYVDTEGLGSLYFFIIMCLYTFILFSNLLLIVLICVNRSLHEPMYIFLCSLFVSELFGSTGVFPLLLVQVLSDSNIVTRSFCFVQIFCVYSYVSIESFNLAAMAYDRYLAICCPLQYNTRMTTKKVGGLIAFTWILPFLGTAVLISLSAPLQLCGNVITKIFCGNYGVVKLACFDTIINNVFGIIYVIISIVIPLVLILYTYMKILKVCYSGSKQTRQKALSTCTPHMASLINFSFGCCFQVLLSRIDLTLPRVLDILLTVYFLTCQPLFNPLMYGLKLPKIHNICKRLLCGDV
ncbi:olfactory receptor 11A1-like [Cheilinus undulatus]|uniref:olfactory receptor 11A1-like n=1 Tax=Cheilinus undulatus TaxID=241271 RepID=UPI001BD3E54B|nr:olfactory receptor 11A1-like [Cheilinus undulatus]